VIHAFKQHLRFSRQALIEISCSSAQGKDSARQQENSSQKEDKKELQFKVVRSENVNEKVSRGNYR
jgi:hypothetical protein